MHRSEPPWHVNHETVSDQHSRTLPARWACPDHVRRLPTFWSPYSRRMGPTSTKMGPTSTRRRELRVANSLSLSKVRSLMLLRTPHHLSSNQTLDDRFVDNLVSPPRLLRSDLRDTLHLDVCQTGLGITTSTVTTSYQQHDRQGSHGTIAPMIFWCRYMRWTRTVLRHSGHHRVPFRWVN